VTASNERAPGAAAVAVQPAAPVQPVAAAIRKEG
jgi:hypothetical protein